MTDQNIARQSDRARVRVVPDEEPYDGSYLDTWDLSPEDLARERAALWETIEREGVWGFVAEYQPAPGAPWIHVDSCWGFVGAPPAEELDAAFTEAKRLAALRPCEGSSEGVCS